MSILELLIALDDEGFKEVFSCEGEIIVLGNKPQMPPELAFQLRLNKPELLPLLRRVSKEQLMKAAKAGQPPPSA